MPEITMPRLSDTMQEGKVARWLKRPGDPVQRGDVLAEIETDKATMELEAYDAGVLERVLVREGETVPIGQPIAVVGAGSAAAGSPEDSSANTAARQDTGTAAASDGDRDAASPPAATDESASAQAAPEAEAAPAAAPSPPAPQRAASEPREPPQAQAPSTPQAPAAPAAPSEDGSDEVRASPMARAIARERGIDLRGVQGSGPGGRIIRADVEAAVDGAHTGTATPAPSPAPAPASAPPAPEAAASAAPAAPPAGGPDVELRPVSRVHQIMAERTLQSVREIPQYFLTIEIDMGEALDLRRQLEATFGDEGRVKINDLVLRAAALALREVPEVNSSWQDGKLAVYRRVNLGIAVAVPDGLLVPVIRDADQKSLRQIAAESQALARRARDGKLQLADMEGGTFSVSNLGMFDVEQFIGIVNPPQAGLLAVGAIVEKPTGVDGQIVLRPRLRATLSADHRAYSGDVGARFLQAFKRLLGEPLRLGF